MRTSDFTLVSYGPAQRGAANSTLTVYLEGDGMAWVTRSRPSDNPTPRDPVALKLALQHQGGAAVYLARPCQYVTGSDFNGCRRADWTNARYSREAVAATVQALSKLKIAYGAKDLVLVGYSGGAAIALLVAAERDDVKRIVTVAGIVDHAAWTSWHRVSALSGSLNPADIAPRIAAIPRIHLVGDDDETAPLALYRGYEKTARVIAVKGFEHSCCWARDWRELWRYAETAASSGGTVEHVAVGRAGAVSQIR